MKKHIPTFNEFVNEQADASLAYDPAKAKHDDATGAPLKSVDELIPGKEYVVTLDGVKHSNMIYQGVTDNVHIFNEEDHNEEPKSFSTDAISKVVVAGGITPVVM